MVEIGKLLLTFGIIFSLLGIAMMLGFKWPRLPGDVVIQRDSFTFVFPITSAIIISLILTFIVNLFIKR